MRTKTLLIAAAAIAAGVISSQAQSNVYSANIVGYVNIQVQPNSWNLMANPLDLDGTNYADQVIQYITTNPLYDDSTVITFVSGQYHFYQYDQTAAGWLDAGGNPTTRPTIPPGSGFFFQQVGLTTNFTFVGSVVSSNTTVIQPNSWNLLASHLPVSDIVTNTATINLPFPDLFQAYLLTYIGGHYQYYSLDTSVGGSGWTDSNDSAPVWATGPFISVGQGFFYQTTAGVTTWTQSLSQ